MDLLLRKRKVFLLLQRKAFEDLIHFQVNLRWKDSKLQTVFYDKNDKLKSDISE